MTDVTLEIRNDPKDIRSTIEVRLAFKHAVGACGGTLGGARELGVGGVAVEASFGAENLGMVIREIRLAARTEGFDEVVVGKSAPAGRSVNFLVHNAARDAQPAG